ncbi:MAG: hypothetical protein V7707_20185 [Motiliproteus sp.]
MSKFVDVLLDRLFRLWNPAVFVWKNSQDAFKWWSFIVSVLFLLFVVDAGAQSKWQAFSSLSSSWSYVIESSIGIKIWGAILILLAASLVRHGYLVYKGLQRNHDFALSNVRITVDGDFRERTIHFDIENLCEDHIYLHKVQTFVIEGDEELRRGWTGGRANPLRQGEIFEFSTCLDWTEQHFHLTRHILKNEYMLQAYTIRIALHYSVKSPLSKHSPSLNVQQFEYLYNVTKGDQGIISEGIRDIPWVTGNT